MQSICSRSTRASDRARSTRPIETRPPTSNTSLNTRPFSTTATLRRSEENSTAKIFIDNLALGLGNLIDPNEANLGATDVVRFVPSLDPFDDRHAFRVDKILVQTSAADLLARVETVKVEMKEWQSSTAIHV